MRKSPQLMHGSLRSPTFRNSDNKAAFGARVPFAGKRGSGP